MRYFILLLFLLLVASAKAQFFFDFSPRQQMEQRRETVTPPTYKGGDEAVKAYLQRNFKQPLVREKVDGRIVVAVIVNAKGNVESAQIIRSLTKSLDAEAIKVCKKMKFKPATSGKKKVRGRVDIAFPIRNGKLSFLNLPTTDV
ncbi:MAG: TonB family protein [Bacteroidaceae bacterium]|nr:TonB family protein [Bacteroidaceae bacterium]